MRCRANDTGGCALSQGDEVFDGQLVDRDPARSQGLANSN